VAWGWSQLPTRMVAFLRCKNLRSSLLEITDEPFLFALLVDFAHKPVQIVR
jgi:hypothetical protein